MKKMYDATVWYTDNGFDLAAMACGTKRTVHPWKGVSLSCKQKRELFDDGNCEIAIKTGRCSKCVVLDIDDKAALLKAKEHFGRTYRKVATPSGGQHWYYKIEDEVIGNRIKMFGVGLDLRAEHGLAKAPPSKDYRFLQRGEMTAFDSGWLPPKKEQNKEPLAALENNRWRARRYIACIEAVEGSGGDTQLYKASCALIRMFGLNQQEAFEELCFWNAYNAQPPFSEMRLRYKISEAMKG